MITVIEESKLSIVCIMENSVSWSNALVASSSISIFPPLYKALAMPILCLCPPDNIDPFSPTLVLYERGRSWINSSAHAIFAADITSSKDASGNIENYDLIASTTFEIEKDENTSTISFEEKFSMENFSDDFEEDSYEKEIKENFAESNYNKFISHILQK